MDHYVNNKRVVKKNFIIETSEHGNAQDAYTKCAMRVETKNLSPKDCMAVIKDMKHTLSEMLTTYS